MFIVVCMFTVVCVQMFTVVDVFTVVYLHVHRFVCMMKLASGERKGDNLQKLLLLRCVGKHKKKSKSWLKTSWELAWFYSLWWPRCDQGESTEVWPRWEHWGVTIGRALRNCGVTKGRELRCVQGERTEVQHAAENKGATKGRRLVRPRGEDYGGEAVVIRSSDLWLVMTNCTGPGLPRPQTRFTWPAAAIFPSILQSANKLLVLSLVHWEVVVIYVCPCGCVWERVRVDAVLCDPVWPSSKVLGLGWGVNSSSGTAFRSCLGHDLCNLRVLMSKLHLSRPTLLRCQQQIFHRWQSQSAPSKTLPVTADRWKVRLQLFKCACVSCLKSKNCVDSNNMWNKSDC